MRGNSALQAAAYELERQRASDSLKKGLEKRSQKEDLVERTFPSNVHNFSYIKQLLGVGANNKALPGNILPHSNAAPGIQGQQRELEKSMRADSLNEKLLNRPKPDELVKDGVLKEDPTNADNDKLYEERMEEEYAKREGGA